MDKAKRNQEEEMKKLQQKFATPLSVHVFEGASEEQEAQSTGDISLEGVSGVGSELERVFLEEKDKAMAAKLKV